MYAVSEPEQVRDPVDSLAVVLLRDSYRRAHLQQIAPDAADGKASKGNWAQVVGAAYDRSLCGIFLETTPDDDDRLIQNLNSQNHRKRFNLLSRNCADSALSIIADLGITMPKHAAKSVVRYSHKRPELGSLSGYVPQRAGAGRDGISGPIEEVGGSVGRLTALGRRGRRCCLRYLRTVQSQPASALGVRAGCARRLYVGFRGRRRPTRLRSSGNSLASRCTTRPTRDRRSEIARGIMPGIGCSGWGSTREITFLTSAGSWRPAPACAPVCMISRFSANRPQRSRMVLRSGR